MSLQTCFFQNKQLTRSSQDKDHITWAIDNFSTGLQTFVRASVKKGLAVCTTDKKHKIWWFKMVSLWIRPKNDSPLIQLFMFG